MPWEAIGKLVDVMAMQAPLPPVSSVKTYDKLMKVIETFFTDYYEDDAVISPNADKNLEELLDALRIAVDEGKEFNGICDVFHINVRNYSGYISIDDIVIRPCALPIAKWLLGKVCNILMGKSKEERIKMNLHHEWQLGIDLKAWNRVLKKKYTNKKEIIECGEDTWNFPQYVLCGLKEIAQETPLDIPKVCNITREQQEEQQEQLFPGGAMSRWLAPRSLIAESLPTIITPSGKPKKFGVRAKSSS